MKPALGSKSGLLGEDEEEPRDLVLGAPALLGIFFAVAVVCALCFGFGYSRGRPWRVPDLRSLRTENANAARPEAKPPGGTDGSAAPAAKPPPGVSLRAAEAPYKAPSGNARDELPSMPPRSEAAQAAPAPVGVLDVQHVAPAGANLLVQIAAVTRSTDAQALAAALRRNGFAAAVRTSRGDSFYHVQVGPFPTFAAAKAMRARLTDSGYNAFIKP